MRGRARRQKESEHVAGLGDVCKKVIYDHVFGNADREVGGVLVGKVESAGARPVVSGAIPAIAAAENRATLTFTQDAWSHVYRTMDEDFPDDQIIGWYHSHPSFGIFLSEHDLFIHRNFFANPSQIAFVVDPIGGEEGVFVWADDGSIDVLFLEKTKPGWKATSQDGS